MCLISIIIPTYNVGQTIVSCLQSIFKQTFADYEILIQDGGSTDNTLTILSSIKDSRVKVVSEKDLGVYDAMNKAVLRSRGSWLYFLGSDDSLFADNVFEVIAERLKETEAAVWYGNVKLIGEGGVIQADEEGIYRGYTPIEELFLDNICHQAMFYKASLIKQGDWNYELRYPIQADHMLNIKLASNYAFEYNNIVVARFQHGGISTRSTDPNFLLDLGGVLLDYYGGILNDRKFYKYKSILKIAAKSRLREGKLSSAIKGYLIYLKLKMRGK